MCESNFQLILTPDTDDNLSLTALTTKSYLNTEYNQLSECDTCILKIWSITLVTSIRWSPSPSFCLLYENYKYWMIWPAYRFRNMSAADDNFCDFLLAALSPQAFLSE